MNPFNPKRFAVGDGLGLSADRAGNAVVFADGLVAESNFAPPLASSGFVGCWAPRKIDATHISLTPGSFTCGAIFTPSVSSITVSSTSLEHIYLRATLSPSYTDGYVTGGSASAVSIIASTTTLTSDNTYGYILLCDWQAGALVARYEFFSLSAALKNAGAGDVLFLYWTS